MALLATALAALALGGSAFAATPQQLTITASDGTALACSLTEPDATPPAGGWPAVMLFHGLGGRHQDLEPLATQILAPAGYAALACDARGHGASGGLFGLDGPRDVLDTKELFAWLTARPEISDTQIGALGISLGGGAVWNATVAGVPFKAIVPVITWTNLTTALAPQGLSKSGLVQLLASLVPQTRWDPDLLGAQSSLVTSTNMGTVTALGSTRSRRTSSSRARSGSTSATSVIRRESRLPQRPTRGSTGAKPSSGSTITSKAQLCLCRPRSSSSATIHMTERRRRTDPHRPRRPSLSRCPGARP